MGIAADFLFKHVRPYQVDGVETYFNASWRAYVLGTLGASPQDVAVLVTAWTETAMSDPDVSLDPFRRTAGIVTTARGQELYRPSLSTILFLNGDQLALLSNTAGAADPESTFAVDFSSDPIEVAVTVDANDRATVARRKTGIRISTDAARNAVHFAGFAR